MVATIPVTNAQPLRLSDKDGRGSTFGKAPTTRITMTNNEIVDFIQAVTAIAYSNAESCRQET